MRPINADKLSDLMSTGIKYHLEETIYQTGWNNAIEEIMETEPTLDNYKEIVYGEWIEYENDTWKTCECSNCDMEFKGLTNIFCVLWEKQYPKYCPNCGAQMKNKVFKKEHVEENKNESKS